MSEDNLFSQFQIYPVTSEKAGSLVANGKCVVAGTLKVSFTIMKNKEGGLFASFPAQKVEKDGKAQWYPYMNFVDESTKGLFQEAVLSEYGKLASAAPAKATKAASKTSSLPF